MNILIDKLPDYIEVNGNQFPIKTDFRHWIKFTQIMLENKPEFQKIADIYCELFCKLPKAPLTDVLNAIMCFYSPLQNVNLQGKNNNTQRQYDYDVDAELIYSAFQQQYEIDLTVANLHWWQFKALLNNLNDATQFIKVVGYRSIDLSKLKDKEQRKYYSKMKHIYKLPDNRTEEEKEKAMNDIFEKVF